MSKATDMLRLNSTKDFVMYTENRKSGAIAYLLWLFFSWIGAHRFYLNEPIGGLTYIVLLVFAAMFGSLLFLGIHLMFTFVDLFYTNILKNKYNEELVDEIKEIKRIKIPKEYAKPSNGEGW